MSVRTARRIPPEELDLDAEREVDVRGWWEAVKRRWWLPVLGLLLGLAVGYALALGGGEVYRAEATLAVFPYRGGESASGALATALGHGRPAVVSDVLGELVEEHDAGVVVPRDDAAALAAAIRELLDDPVALERAFRGTEAARRGLSWDAIAEAHERLYSDLLAKVGGL